MNDIHPVLCLPIFGYWSPYEEKLSSLGTLQFEKGMTKGSYEKGLQYHDWHGTDDE